MAKAEKELVKTTKSSTKTYSDGLVVVETKVIEGDNIVDLPKEITQNKLTKEDSKTRKLVSDVKVVDRRYSDGSKNITTKEYSYENGTAELVKDLLTYSK